MSGPLSGPGEWQSFGDAIREEIRVARLIEALRPYLLSSQLRPVIPAQRRAGLNEQRWNELVAASARAVHVARERRIRADNVRYRQGGYL